MHSNQCPWPDRLNMFNNDKRQTKEHINQCPAKEVIILLS
jgi:hypothetical protein